MKAEMIKDCSVIGCNQDQNNHGDSRNLRDPSLLVEYKIPQKPRSNLTWALNWAQYDSSRVCWNILLNEAGLYMRSGEANKYLKYQNSLSFYAACTQL